MPDKSADRVSFDDFKALYLQCTPDQREELVITMARMLEKKRRATLAVLMADPRQLTNLPVSQLREVADMGLEDAHSWILENAPTATHMLYAVEVLTAFTITKDEPTAADLRDVVTSLEDVWKAAGGKYADDLAAFDASHLEPTPAVGQSASEESRPARAGRRPERKADKKRKSQ